MKQGAHGSRALRVALACSMPLCRERLGLRDARTRRGIAWQDVLRRARDRIVVRT